MTSNGDAEIGAQLSQDGKFCTLMDRSGVPADFHWRSFLSHLRGVKSYTQLTTVQKEQFQELLLRLLSEKDFSESSYNCATSAFLNIITASCEKKLLATLKEGLALVEDVKGIMGKRVEEVSIAADHTISVIETGLEPAELIASVRSTFKEVITKMEKDAATIETLVLNDGLTNIANRRGFDLFLHDAMTQWEKDKIPVALIMFDIDNFKKFNDKHGHRIGDQALQVVAQHTRRVSEKYSDSSTKIVSARYGGEEFSLIVLGRRAKDVVAIAEDLRGVISRFSFIIRDPDGNVLESNIHITVSLGAARPWKEWTGAYTENLVDAADKALYFAKRSGKNRAAMYTPEQETQYTIFDPGKNGF